MSWFSRFDDHWGVLRGLRASPPGRAGGDERRRAVFAAALEQSEQFLRAGVETGYATKPVQLFYALSQAGRAIAAARAESDWEIVGHGAKVRTGTHVGDTAVEVDRRKRGALLRVADATRSCLWDGEANLGALWASLPELGGETAVSGAAPQALRLEPDPFPAGTWSQTVERYVVPGGQSSSLTVRVSLDLGRAKDDTTVAEQVEAKLAAYPTAGGWTVTSPWQAATGEGPVGLMWVKEEGGQRILTAVETLTERWNGYLYLRPGIGSASHIPSPLITWWGLMLGLSSLARYEPVMWRDALDIDSSPAANGLEQALRTAEWRIPELVLTALTDV